MRLFTDRIYREGRTIRVMIALFCKQQHGLQVRDCEHCSVLQNYALDRLEQCPFHEGKTSCKHCPVHCYKPSMKEAVRRVMRYSGPRMLFRHPVLTIYHFIDDGRKEPLKPLGAKEAGHCPDPDQ